MNTTNIKERDLVICVNSDSKLYLRICEILDIQTIPNDGAIESVIIKHNVFNNFTTTYCIDKIPYKKFEGNFKKLITEYAY